MEVVATNEITIWPLRSLFPCQVKPPFGYTDNLGESSAAGRPLQDTSGNIWAGNDPGYNPSGNAGVTIGGVEYDPVIGCVYPKTILLLHDQAMGLNGTPLAPGSALIAPGRSGCPYTYAFYQAFVALYGQAAANKYLIPASSYVTGPPSTSYLGAPPDQVEIGAYLGNPIVMWDNYRTVGRVQGGLGITPAAVPPSYYAAVAALATDFGGTPAYPYNGQTFVVDGHPPSPCQAFHATFKLGYLPLFNPSSFIILPAYSNAPNLAGYVSARWRVGGSGRNERWYSAAFHSNGDVLFHYNDSAVAGGNPDETQWVFVDKIKLGSLRADQMQTQLASGSTASAGSSTASVQPFAQSVEVRLLGGQMQVRLSADDTPYVWPHCQTDEDGNPDWYIDKFAVGANLGGNFTWAFHPLRFLQDAGLLSNPVNAGYPVDDYQEENAEFIIHTAPSYLGESDLTDDNVRTKGFLPPGGLVTSSVADVVGTNLFYNLEFENAMAGTAPDGTQYSDYTAVVKAVSVDIPGEAYADIGFPDVLGTPGAPPMPQQWDVWSQFDLSTLSYRQSAALTFNNFQGNWTNWNNTGYLDQNGQFGITIGAGQYYAGYGNRREFTGIGNTNFTNDWQGGGKDFVTVFCADCWEMLDVPVWNVPWMDGRNVYWVMAYLAGLGTITQPFTTAGGIPVPGQIGWADYIPDDPYGPSPGLPDDLQFYMPVGPAGATLTRFGGGQSLKDIMLKISVALGFSLYFDVYGVLQFQKFQFDPLTPIQRIFSHVAGDASNLNNLSGAGTDEIWSGQYSGSLKETRNSVTVIGVNALGPLWQPLVAHEVDLYSVYGQDSPDPTNGGWPIIPSNYIGWPKPLVWADNIFANLPFAESAAASLLNYLRLPDRKVAFSTWYPPSNGPVGVPEFSGLPPYPPFHPGIYPGDLIQVAYPRSAASLFTFFVESTHVQIVKGQAPRLDIQGRLIPQST